MIYLNRRDLSSAIDAELPALIADKTKHSQDTSFQFGGSTHGYYMVANNVGWAYLAEGVHIRGQARLASPLSNLQAAAEVLRG